MFSFLSGVYIYVIAWVLLGQDSGDSLQPKHLSDFAVSILIEGRESQVIIIIIIIKALFKTERPISEVRVEDAGINR